jgi:peptide deformylase
MAKTQKKKKLGLPEELKRRPLALQLYPDSILRGKAEPVQMFNTALQDFANDMLLFMKQSDGIGLAAPQVGILQRIVVADIGEHSICLVNPEILNGSGGDNMVEGCLSLPGCMVDVSRKTWIDIRGRDLFGRKADFQAEGLLARVLQHEVDHLNGILICDHGESIPGP